VSVAYHQQLGGTSVGDVFGEGVVGLEVGDNVRVELGVSSATGWDVELVILSAKLKVKEMWLAWTRMIALEVSQGL
jgi:hypothetical protein